MRTSNFLRARIRKESTLSTLNSSVNTEKSLEILSQTKVLEKDFTVYGTAEEPLFLAKDVAAMIDYAKTSRVLITFL